jgi:hypothetical protein
MFAIASRYWSKAVPMVYVAQVKGDGGKDWGYTTDYSKACALSPFWQRRFAADCRRAGEVACFSPVPAGFDAVI